MIGPGARPSPRAILALAFAPSAGLGALAAMGPMLAGFLPTAPRLLRIVAVASWLVLAGLVLALAGAALAVARGFGPLGPAIFLLGLLLAAVAFAVRGVSLARLMRGLMAHPLVAALMTAALAPAPPQEDDQAS